MKYLYYFFRLFMCPHKWETIQLDKQDYVRPPGSTNVIFTKHVYTLRCKYCGEIKFREIRL